MTTLDQRLERIITNYRVISKLKIGNRLLFKNKNVSIQNYYTIMTPMIRTIAKESRGDIIHGLLELYEDTNALITDYVNSQKLKNLNINKSDRDSAFLIFLELNNMKSVLSLTYKDPNEGLNAIFNTYIEDPETSAKIEGIIEKFKGCLIRINLQINYLIERYELQPYIDQTMTIDS
jgi:hypothetical protein